MVLWIFNRASNSREHGNGAYSYCPSEKGVTSDIELVKKTYEAINEYNLGMVLENVIHREQNTGESQR